MVRFTAGSEGQLLLMLELIQKKVVDLSRERSGKVQVQNLKQFILQTLLSVEKAIQVIAMLI